MPRRAILVAGLKDRHATTVQSVAIERGPDRAFRDARTRRRWLGDVALTVRSAVANKSMRVTWPDGTSVEWYFIPKGAAKSQVAVQHVKLADRDSVDRMKAWWAERLGELEKLLKPAPRARR